MKLRACCGQLASDKVSERKKQIDIFKRELGKPSVCRQLDQNSQNRRGMIWEHCFEAVREFMVKEVEHVKSKQGKGSFDHRKLLSTGSIFKWFVQKANNNGEYLDITVLVEHILYLVRDEVGLLCYGMEFCMVVNKELLGSWKYRCRMTSKSWQDFLKYFCKCLLNPPKKMSLDLLANLVQQLFAGAVHHANIRKGLFFSFFKQIIETFRSEFSGTMISTVLGALNSFCIYAAGDCRSQVCSLGEESILTLLHIWKNQSLSTKETLVEFLHLQMRVHHPKGALTEAEGAMATNQEQWKGLVQKIYEVLYMEWTQASSKLKLKGSGAKEVKFSSLLVEFAADVCHQVFAGPQDLLVPDSFETFSQGSTPKRKITSTLTPAKRRKLESGWKMLRDHMTHAGQSPSIIPWLQLAEALIRKYPRSLPVEEIPEFLAVFVQLQSECKRGEIHTQLLLCLNALAVCQGKQSDPGGYVCTPLTSDWSKVWAATIRMIGLRTTEEEGFTLLKSLLMYKLVTPGYEIWKLFASSIVLPTQHSVDFISVLLANTYLPEKHSVEFGTNCQSSHPLREHLVNWLFSSVEAQDISEGLKMSTISAKGIQSTVLARVLCSLICKSPKSVLRDGDALTDSTPDANLSPLDEMEDLYLCSSFDSFDEEFSSQENRAPFKEIVPSWIPEMLQYLMGKLSEVCNGHQQIEFLEFSPMQCAIQFSAVAVKVITLLVAKDIVPLDDGSLSQLMRSIKSLLNQLAESMKTALSNVDEANKEEILQTFHPAIKDLVDLFSWSSGHSQSLDKETRSFSDVLQASFSPDLLDLLVTFVINRGFRKKDNPSTSDNSRQTAADDFDDEFDTVPSMSNKIQDSEEDEFALPQSSMGVDPESDTAPGNKHTQYSTSDQFLLTSCTAVAHCCQSLLVDHQGRGNPGINKLDLIKRLLQSFEEENWDPKPPTATLQMVFTAINIILQSTGQVDDGHVLLILNIFRSIASTYRRDQDTCCKILQSISVLIPRLAVKEGRTSMDLLSARETTLYLLNAFWTLQKEGYYTTLVRLEFVRCLQALLKVDPDSQWAFLKPKEKGQGDSGSEVKIRDILAAQLTDPSHFLRVHIAKNIKSFFHDAGDDQNLTFDLLYQTLQSGMTLKGKLTINEQADEASNRTSTLLVGLSCIAKYSPACLKKVVFALIQAIKLNGLEIHVVQKVLDQIWKHWGYKDSLSFMEAHLGFLVDQWLQLDYSLMEFPHHLLDCQSLAQFYRKFHKLLVPYLILCDKMGFVKTMAEKLNEDWMEMVKQSFSCTMAFILPLLVDDNAEQRERKRNATLCLDNLNSVFSQKVLETLIQTNLPHILVELLTRLYQPCTEDSTMKVYIRPTDPEPNSPYFSATNILATLDHLMKCHSNSESLTLVLLLAKSQDSLQKILHFLHAHIEKSHTMEDKHRGLLAYHLFVKLVLKDLESGLGKSWMFVLRTVINMLTQTIKDFLYKKHIGGDDSIHDRCLMICVDTLHAVCESCLQPCPQELSRYLQGIIEVLVSLLNGAVKQQSLALIHLLVVKSSKVLIDSLKDIDPLPDLPQLQTATDALMAIKMKDGDINLLDEMSMFLMKEKIHSVGGLVNLKKLLSERKDELAVLIGQCKEEGSDALVPRVICTLIKLCTESQHSDIQQQAAACLGEIGAPNMSLIALHSVGIEESMCYSTAAGVYSDNPRGCRNAILVHLLNKNLIQQEVDTIQAASSCLKNIFATPSGQQFYEDYRSKNIDNLLNYLHPFKPNRKKTFAVPVFATAEEDILTNLDSPSLWQPAGGISHDNWVKNLTVGLIKSGAVKDEILLLMEPVCSVKAAFAESVLPYLIHDILLNGDAARSAILSTQMSNVFSRVCETEGVQGSRATSPQSNRELGDVYPNVGKKCVQTLLQVVHYLRTQQKPTGSRQKGSPWDNNFWLDINYLLLAKSAQLCQAHFTCLLYSEIWCNINKSQTETSTDSSDSGSQHSLETLLSNSEINVQKLLLEAYTSIGEPDGLYGCGVSRMTDHLARIHKYEHEGDWTSAMAGYDLINPDDTSTQTGLLQALQNAGLDHILQTYLKGVKMDGSGETDSRLAEAQYEAAWRNGIWDIPDQSSDQHYSGFHNCLYRALCSIGDKDQPTFSEALERGRCFVSEQLHHASLESIHSVYPFLTQLQVLKETDEIQSVAFSKQPLHSILEKWNQHEHLIDTSFDFLEMTFNLRTSGLRVLSQQCPGNIKSSVQRGLTEQLLIYSEAARKAKRFQIAEKSLAAVKSLEGSLGVDTIGSLQWRRWLQEAELFWAKTETSTALHLMKALIEKLSKLSARHETHKQIYPEALTIYGKWLAESRTESPHIIIENYLEKAVSICEVASSSMSTCMTSYLTLARFADAQYQHIVNYMKSPEYESKKGILDKYRTDAEQLTAMGDMKTRYYRTLLKQGDLDESEMESLQQDKARYLNTSVECYLKYLNASSAELDIPVFRLCSLWFNNATDDIVNKLMKEFVQKLPSSKFLPMLYQLAARMTIKTQEKQDFHTILQELIEKAAKDHPFHTLPIILALANANKDATITSTNKGGRLSRNGPQMSDASHADEDRMQAAISMVSKLKTGERTTRIIRDMEKLSDAYIELAYWDVTQYKKVTKPISFAPNLQICTLRNLQTAVSTLDMPVDPTCRYANVITIQRFEPTFKLAGGINLPKIIMCIGSDGQKKKTAS